MNTQRPSLAVIGRAVDLRGEALVLAAREVVALEDGLLPQHGAAPAADDLLGGRLPGDLHRARREAAVRRGAAAVRAARGDVRP